MDFLKEQNIHIYSTHSDLKAVFVERFNRTLLDLSKEPMNIEGKACWLNHLDTAMEKNNNRVHTTTRMTPTFVNKPKQPKFHCDKRNLYSQGYTTNWNRELFKIYKINNTNPVTYGLVDENNEQIEGKYYEQELLRSIFNFKSNQKVLESMNDFHKFEKFYLNK